MAHPKHFDVRQRYEGRCGYCGVSEGETGGELTVDHFRPVCAGGDDSDDNLVYCCFRCNGYKSDFSPTPDDILNGFHVLHPLLDRAALHLLENQQSGRIDALTKKGSFHIGLLHLNRPQLVEFRLNRRLHELLLEACQVLHDENDQLRHQVLLLEHYLAEVRGQG